MEGSLQGLLFFVVDMKAFIKEEMKAFKAYAEGSLEDKMVRLQEKLRGIHGQMLQDKQDWQQLFVDALHTHLSDMIWKVADRCDKGASKLEVMERRMEALTYSLRDCTRPWGLWIFIHGYGWLFLVIPGWGVLGGQPPP